MSLQDATGAKTTDGARRSALASRAAVRTAALIAGALAIFFNSLGLFDGGRAAHDRWANQDEVTITINAGGFNPSEITRPAGKFLLSVDNRSGVAEITLRLSRADGEHLRDIPVPKEAADWGEEIDLGAGQYVLTEVNHPAWVCRITAR